MKTKYDDAEGKASEEGHEEVSRGWYIPNSITYLYEGERILNAEEVLLLGKVNALCDPQKGCWASNKWLAKWWNKTPVWVSTTLNKFEELGLIEIVIDKNKGNRRVIWCCFQPDRLLKKTRRPMKENFHSYERKLEGVLSRNKYSKNKVVKHCPEPARAARGAAGQSVLFPALMEKVDSFIQEITSKLETYVRVSRKISPHFNRKKWYQEIKLLLNTLQGDKERLESVLDDFIQLPHNEYTPHVESAESFHRKFLQVEAWVVRAIKERERENGEPEGTIENYVDEEGCECNRFVPRYHHYTPTYVE